LQKIFIRFAVTLQCFEILCDFFTLKYDIGSITLYGTATRMINTGIFISKGARYSVFAEGKIKKRDFQVGMGPASLLVSKIGDAESALRRIMLCPLQS